MVPGVARSSRVYHPTFEGRGNSRKLRNVSAIFHIRKGLGKGVKLQGVKIRLSSPLFTGTISRKKQFFFYAQAALLKSPQLERA